MKEIWTILLLAIAVNARALISSNLVADWQGGVGVTAAGGRVSEWDDQHQLLNSDGLGPHNLTQTNPLAQPYVSTNYSNCNGVLFPWAFNPSLTNCLNIPASLGGLSTTSLTVYAVATGPANQDENQSLVWFGGLPSGWIKFYRYANFPSLMLVGTQPSAINPPINRAVFVGSCDGSSTTMRWNNVTQTGGSQSPATSGGGGRVGSFNGQEFFYGVIYRIMIYKAAHTPAQMDAQVAELAALYNVQTNFTKQAVCRGDSITAGVGSTRLQSWPFQLCERYPEIEWRNQGIAGSYIGTNGDGLGSSSMFDIDGSYIDPLYDTNLQQNTLLIFAGVNDIRSGVDGVSTFKRLTNYVAARKAAQPWRVVVSTIQAVNSDGANANIAVYNNQIRTNAGNWDARIDPGYNSPVETALNNPYDPTYYYTDNLHLVNAGYGVLANHFGQVVNVPHRTTGFFAP